ncbi:MAG TPA: VWA domain-containing protein [Tepidisphaeraceae bacterium]|jgi:uncharacterized membrane protein|nr:VWA domain-containing protein [Tepidisphaeraceae bacterium]
MLLPNPLSFLAFTSPLNFDYYGAPKLIAAFVVIAIPIILLGLRSLSSLGTLRQWLAIGLRLLVLLFIILILGGVRWQRVNKDLEVFVVRDVSQSTTNVKDYPGGSLQSSIEDQIRQVVKRQKPPADRIGVISFARAADVDAMASTSLELGAGAIRERQEGTDAAAALQLAMAAGAQDAMHRLVLFWDGNATTGDLDPVLNMAAANHIPIDVVPLRYNVTNEVMIDRFVVPTFKRENEPYSVDVILRSTNPVTVTGKLSITQEGHPIDLNPGTGGTTPSRRVTLQPGLNRVSVQVPGTDVAGVYRFHATFEPDHSPSQPAADSILENNSADGFTFIRGKGRLLYVDQSRDNGSQYVIGALAKEGIEVRPDDRISASQFPNNLASLEAFDAVILDNVPRGAGGLNDSQERVLTSYVSQLGGGLVMIGGDSAYGAGGWQGSKLEEILPVSMDVPAQRQIPKAALVLIIDAIEQPEGNYWAQQCALKAVETLSAGDDVGVISWPGKVVWDYPIQPKGDGTHVNAAIKSMNPGDFPSFDDMMLAALNGANGQPGILANDARQKHVIIISDDDPQAPTEATLEAYRKAKITVSTVIDFPHGGVDPNSIMTHISEATKGRTYGPIYSNISQLPQIFVKEATVVRRSLIHEEKDGIQVKTPPSMSDLVKGIPGFPSIYGLILTSKKQSPFIEVPLLAGKSNDPLLAHWQTGQGHVAVFTSDAHNLWASGWVGSPMFSKFWSQVVRGTARSPLSTDLQPTITNDGQKGHISIEALNKDAGFQSFLNITGTVIGPDGSSQDIHPVQTGVGTYSTDFKTPLPGAYVVALHYQGPGHTSPGFVIAGTAVNGSPEMRDLHSNDVLLQQVADRTGGRVLPAFDLTNDTNWFRRENLYPSVASTPIWDLLIPFLLALLLLDIANRRVAWDWQTVLRLTRKAADYVRSFTVLTAPQGSGATLSALRGIREKVTEERFTPKPNPTPRPVPTARFEAPTGVEGDITKLVGGADGNTTTPSKPTPSNTPPGTTTTGSLIAAKRRAQQQMKRDQ